MWRNLRIAILLLVLAIVGYGYWFDRQSTTRWNRTVWIGLFPINAEGGAAGAAYIEGLTPGKLADIEQFINGQAKAYGIEVDRPVRIEVYGAVTELPPRLSAHANAISNIWWSLKLRLYARRNSHPAGRPAPQIRIFVLYHDPSFNQAVPHSVGLQKGLVGVVHAYAEADMTRPNNVVIAHEILHTLGATDKYDPATLAPLYPAGYVEPEQSPRYPQSLTEIMAGRRAVAADDFEMPDSLKDARVGAATAREIRWIRK